MPRQPDNQAPDAAPALLLRLLLLVGLAEER